MIAIAGDHAAIELKKQIIEHLEKLGYDVFDFGTKTAEAVDYPDYAAAVCKAIQDGRCDTGILICGSGIGMSIAANKMKGIRCALCHDTYSARLTRLHNDANVLALGERVLGPGLALDVVDAFLNNKFSQEPRHKNRIEKILKLEEENK